MAKRLTDTEIWEQDWFIELPTKYKLTWNFIKDKCDDCGVWRPNKSLLQRIIGEPVNLEEFLTFINIDGKERIRILKNNRWFLVEYFFFQYGDKFNPKSPVHRGALKRLLQNNVHPKELSYLSIGKLESIDIEELKEIGYQKGSDSILKAYTYTTDRDKDKDKDKGMDKEYVLVSNLLPENEKDKTMVVVEMMKIWMKHRPDYTGIVEADYPALLDISYIMAKSKGWQKSTVVGEHEQDILDGWEKICAFLSGTEADRFLRSLTIDGISIPKNFQKVVESMKVGKSAVIQKQKEAEKGRITHEQYFKE
jgi:hypothetical protein